MNIWVPATEIQTVTQICLRNYQHYVCDVSASPFSYCEYFQKRWSEQRTFINVEHDIAFWPGSLEALWDCPHLWCAYGYHLNDNFSDHYRTLFPYLGMVKFDKEIIINSSNIFDEMKEWLGFDQIVAERLRGRGFDVHQHYPPIINANPILSLPT